MELGALFDIEIWKFIKMFIGNQKVKKFLDNCLAKGSLNHAYLFLGPEQVGKFTLAKSWAQKIVNNDKEINPDLIIVSPEIKDGKKKDIGISQIRDLQSELSRTAANSQYKVAIIDDADRLNKAAQNALLKTLEEPPQKVILILIAQNKRQLLETIYSRCQVIKFNLVSGEEIERMIPQNFPDKNKIFSWSWGRPGIVQKMLDNPNELSEREKIEREFFSMLTGNIQDKFLLAESLSKEENLVQKMNVWLVLLRDIFLGRDDRKISSKEALIFSQEIQKSLQLVLETNSNSRLVLENLFLKI